MNGTLSHRGPDGGDVWIDEESGIGLGHRRLAIIDLRETGRQPMTSLCGRYVITYNGELYNTAELRTDLERLGFNFRGTSDTEILVNSISRWGLYETLKRINGIYAFAIWDKQERQLSLVRDRYGVKPLYWSFYNRSFSFGSELRALASLPTFEKSIDVKAVSTYIQYGYIRSPYTIYQNARALEPGTVLCYTMGASPDLRPHWDLGSYIQKTKENREKIKDTRAEIIALESTIENAVRRQMISDVSIGAFLSGGIDSSLVVSMMQRVASKPVKTFSIGFEYQSFNEAEVARDVARHLGTDHTELYVGDNDAIGCISTMAELYDQPFSDPSQIPTHLLCQMTAKQVTVALSGDGGDELFFGYTRFQKAAEVYSILRRVPVGARKFLKYLPLMLGMRGLELEACGSRSRAGHFAWLISRLSQYAETPESVYLHFITAWSNPTLLNKNCAIDIAKWNDVSRSDIIFEEKTMLCDSLTYMPDDVLTKVDRASMGSSLEARVPLLDQEVVEFAWNTPQSLKYRDGIGKWILREVLYRSVPRHIVEREKVGFAAPVGKWLRGPLRDWAENLLSERSLRENGILSVEKTRALWNAHLVGGSDGATEIWNLVMLQAWLDAAKVPRKPVGGA